jgi:hypothetical protein
MKKMTMIEKMEQIINHTEACEMANRLMANKNEANMQGTDTMSISEITELVWNKFFATK